MGGWVGEVRMIVALLHSNGEVLSFLKTGRLLIGWVGRWVDE